ncbi:hypothetical protein R1flu_023015 [Riccia fluitans]|uniref:Uncharacterized protein n=1 Tax=Riccia fluitans TaxID=41844 RepID=A0ABD1XUW9_9MARC
MRAGVLSVPALHRLIADVHPGPTTSALISSTSPPWRLSWSYSLVRRNCLLNLSYKNCGERNLGLRIYAARKNVTSRKIQQSKGRMSEKPSKLGTVGAPLDNNPLIQDCGSRTCVTESPTATNGRGMIEEVLDRSSEIVDPPVANVDNLLIVFSIDQPQIDEKVLSRFLLEAESTGIDFSLVLNKVDLVEQKVVEYWQAKLAEWGYMAVLCSADRKLGLRDLTSLVKNKVTVILGPSGVGKSSLINALRDQTALPLWYDSEKMRQAVVVDEVTDGAEVSEHQFAEEFEALRVGEVSMASGRGRHTTRHVRLLRIPGGDGLLADTPGFSQPSLAKVTSSTLAQLFPEVRRRLEDSEDGGCAFPNCMHLGEPYCAVGDSWERYPHYTDLLEEIRTREKVQKKILGTKRESDMRVKKMGAEGVRKAEPRLALNRHRRESRKQANQGIEELFREEEELQAEITQDNEKEVRAV